MARLPDWRPRLDRYLAEAARRPFRPGTHDCGLFAAGVVEAVTGYDPAAGWLRGRYCTLEEAQALCRARGHADHVAVIAAEFPEVHPVEALAGDLAVVINEEGEPVFGVVLGPRIAVLRVSGLGYCPRSDMVRAFHL